MTPGVASPVEALVDAAAGGDIPLVTELLASGLPVDTENSAQKTALAAALDAGHLGVIRVLLGHGADPDQNLGPPGRLEYPLGRAADAGLIDVARALLDAGAAPDGPVVDGAWRPPLHTACRRGNLALVGLLLDRGADLGPAPDWSALECAAGAGRIEVMRFLLDRGAEPSARAVLDALRDGREGVVTLLRRALATTGGVGAQAVQVALADRVRLLTDAAGAGDEATVSTVLATGVPVDRWNLWRRSALDLAVWNGHAGVAALLLAAGADPEQDIGVYHETFPLRQAALHGDEEMVAALLDGGARAEGHPSSVRRTLRSWQVKVMEPMYGRGSRVGSTSPLTRACQYGYTRIVRSLLERGADPDEPQSGGGLPLNAAAIGGHVGCVELLCEYGAQVTTFHLDRASRGRNRPSEPDPPTAPHEPPDYRETLMVLHAHLHRERHD